MVLMVALAGAGGGTVFVLLAEPDRQVAVRLLGTAGFLALFSLTGLCSAALVERGILRAVGVLGIVASAGAFLVGMAYVWGIVQPAEPGDVRPLAGAVIVAVALAWVSLVLLLLRRSAAVTAAAVATVAAIAALAGLLLVHVVADGARGEPVARVTAVAGILAILGSFLTPLLDRVVRPSRAGQSFGFGPAGPSDPGS